MNERIRKIYNQVTWDDNVQNEEEMFQLFAELLVNQCASIVSLYRRDNMQDKAIADTLEDAYNEIKRAFGIK